MAGPTSTHGSLPPDPLGAGWSSHALGSAAAAPPTGSQGGERRARRDPPAHSLEPRGVGATLDTAFEVLRARFLSCVGFSALLWLPASVLGRWLESNEAFDAAVVAGGSLVLQLGVQSLAVALVTVIVYGEIQGRRVAASQSGMFALLRTPSLLVTTIVVNALVFAGTICCIVPGLVLSWLFMVTPAVLVLEKLGPFQALSRSPKLVRGSIWRWSGLITIQVLLVLPFSGGPALLSDPELFAGVRDWSGLSPLSFEVVQTLVTSALMGVSTAFGAVVLTVYYIDSRVRVEGFDLVMRFERLRGRAVGPRSAGSA